MSSIESRLREYPSKRAEIERVQDEAQGISSAHVSKLETSEKATPGSPVESWYVRVERIRTKIAALERETEPVTRLIHDLPQDLRDLLEQHYFRGIPWRRIWINRNRMTVWRKRKHLQTLILERLGGGKIKNT